MTKHDFPPGFLWGAATSAHQVEGGNTNDWTKWEDKGHVKNQQKSGLAADHWNRYEQDFDLLGELNLNSYRFSIEWSRIEPERGRFDDQALEHYREILQALRKRGIEPVVTLHHFTNPVWLEDWTHQENIDAYINYVKHVVAELGNQVRYWCTINEPMNVVLLAYAGNIWPPQLNSPLKGRRAMKNFMAAHKLAYQEIHSLYESKKWGVPMVGIPLTIPYFTPATKNPADKVVNAVVRKMRNHYFLKRIAGHLDFIGLNHYFTFHSRWNSIKSFTWVDNPDLRLPKSDMGWNIEPEGLFYVLMELSSKYDLPIMITEHGIADEKDVLRKWFITAGLRSVSEAIKRGVHVIGYQHWSLMDNFEWADGYGARFGLIAVNFDNQERIVRDSARVYGQIAKTNQLVEVEEMHT